MPVTIARTISCRFTTVWYAIAARCSATRAPITP